MFIFYDSKKQSLNAILLENFDLLYFVTDLAYSYNLGTYFQFTEFCQKIWGSERIHFSSIYHEAKEDQTPYMNGL